MSETTSQRADARVWWRIGLLSFGGPAGQIALMHRMLVDELRWIDEQRFLAGLNFCMLLPGPEAQQLATYIGWRRGGWRGALVAGSLFVLPGMAIMLALSAAYVSFGAIGLVNDAFVGVKAAVIVIVVEALLRIARRALRFSAAAWIAGLAFVALYAFAVPFPAVVGAAALAGYLAGKGRARDAPTAVAAQNAPLLRSLRPALVAFTAWWTPVLVLLLTLGPAHTLTRIGLFYSEMAVVTFGGAYSVLSYVAERAVEGYGWLSAQQMADGLGLAETTPGPLILVLQFVAFLANYAASSGGSALLAGVVASVLAVWVLFAPSFMWIFLCGPYLERVNANPGLRQALAFVTAAVVGVVANLAVWFASHVWFAQVRRLEIGPVALAWPTFASADWRAIGLTLLAAISLFALKQNLGRTLALAALAGAVTGALLR